LEFENHKSYPFSYLNFGDCRVIIIAPPIFESVRSLNFLI